MAPTPTACATWSLFSSSGFLASIWALARLTASATVGSSRMTFPLRVESFFPSFVTKPKGT